MTANLDTASVVPGHSHDTPPGRKLRTSGRGAPAGSNHAAEGIVIDESRTRSTWP
ncbi:MAG TPA: hypothetical protein VFI15_01755 [Candidatus Limnocylindrales bacterium]|nr:hypothetical protein [Candidatus Limnocylindrales bacterium]